MPRAGRPAPGYRTHPGRADNSGVHPEPFNPNSRLRASDAEREQAAEVLNAALADGRLSVAEHSQRLDALYQAKTHAEIAPVIEDLPSAEVAARPARQVDLAPGSRHRHRIIAIFGGATRRGRWQVEPKMTAVTIFGGATIDFRETELPQQEITLNCTSAFGGMQIVVPPEMRVIDSGIALFGGRDVRAGGSESADPRAPVLRLTGLTIFGGLDVRRKRRKS
jgi:hypothetical protein